MLLFFFSDMRKRLLNCSVIWQGRKCETYRLASTLHNVQRGVYTLKNDRDSILGKAEAMLNQKPDILLLWR